jgi:hypothetical protein
MCFPHKVTRQCKKHTKKSQILKWLTCEPKTMTTKRVAAWVPPVLRPPPIDFPPKSNPQKTKSHSPALRALPGGDSLPPSLDPIRSGSRPSSSPAVAALGEHRWLGEGASPATTDDHPKGTPFFPLPSCWAEASTPQAIMHSDLTQLQYTHCLIH